MKVSVCCGVKTFKANNLLGNGDSQLCVKCKNFCGVVDEVFGCECSEPLFPLRFLGQFLICMHCNKLVIEILE